MDHTALQSNQRPLLHALHCHLNSNPTKSGSPDSWRKTSNFLLAWSEGKGSPRRHLLLKTPIPDPCPTILLSRVFPTKAESVEILRALEPFMNIQAIIYSESHILIELVHGDNREYDRNSLPGIVAGRITTYHHSTEPFFASTQNLARQRTLDPAPYLPESSIGPLPQDGTNYLSEPHFAKLCPGVRVSSGYWTETGEYTDVVASTTCGIHLRKGTQNYVTVANHGFLSSVDVYHPLCEAGGVRIG